LSSDSPDAVPAGAAANDNDLAWAEARAAELAAGAPVVRADEPRADADGRIVLSPDSSANAAAGAATVLAVPRLCVAAGQELVMRGAGGRPLKVATALLEVADGGRVVMETHVELHAARAVFAGDSPVMLVGADGAAGGGGGGGQSGNRSVPGGTNGGEGGSGTEGQPGPGGMVYVGELQGTLTVVAGGGNGGAGGPGGRGGDGVVGYGSSAGKGGNGGKGGPGGPGGEGGTVVIAFASLGPNATINLIPKSASGGTGGTGGDGGNGSGRGWDGNPGDPGARGERGERGTDGAQPVFLIRSVARA
jgi:hypothetical protein